MDNKRSFLRDRPWIWVILGFLLFVAALAHFVSICIRNPQPGVPLTTSFNERH